MAEHADVRLETTYVALEYGPRRLGRRRGASLVASLVASLAARAQLILFLRRLLAVRQQLCNVPCVRRAPSERFQLGRHSSNETHLHHEECFVFTHNIVHNKFCRRHPDLTPRHDGDSEAAEAP